uniref:Cytoplasmic protein n=1 Tax=Thermodesulfobacterium geofontis TaxID=1295609 RepID=A0A7C4JRK7_9BACT
MVKLAFFAFKEEPMCFIHVLLNALDANEKGFEAKIVLEGAATKLIPELFSEKSMFYNFFKKALEKELLAGVCKACAQKMGTLELAKEKGLTILEDMYGHAGMANFIKQGYTIITL